MPDRDRPLTVWLVDPISYTGMAYTDVGQITALQQLNVQSLLLGSDGWMLERELVPRVEVFRGAHGRQSRLRKGARYLVSLGRLLRRVARHRPDIVHWQFTEVPAVDVFAMAAIRLLRIPQLYTAHELLPWHAARHHLWLFRRLYRVVDTVIVHNDDQRTELIRRFRVNASAIRVAPLGDYAAFATPDLSQATAREQLDLPRDQPVALFFGTIRPSKGLEVLLAAWPKVVKEVPSARLLVTGKPFKGLDTTATMALIRDLGIEASVVPRFEQVDPVETNTQYRAADVVVLPYHDIGTSGVLRYAYNSARPVIATAVGEHRSRVTDGETGTLVSPGDPEELAEALVVALADRDHLRTMGEAARRYAAANFRWIDSARKLLSAYEELAGRPGRSSSGPAAQSSKRR